MKPPRLILFAMFRSVSGIPMAAKFLAKRNNHPVEYANGSTSTNIAECFFYPLLDQA